MATENIPSPRDVLASLISSLPAASNPTAANPLTSTSPDIKNIFLTLHVLFPNELLPALDLLDRGLVTRLLLDLQPASLPENHENHPETTATTPDNDANVPPEKAYYVRSAQQQPSNSSRWRNTNPNTSSGVTIGTTYAVQLSAWTCSCPAFAFSAFPATSSSPTRITGLTNGPQPFSKPAQGSWRFGGLSLGEGMPVCKHLMACVLSEYAPQMFGAQGAVEERRVGVDEWAGWAAGWGD